MQFLWPLLLGGIGAFLLYKGATMLVDAATALAKNYGVPLIAVSFTIVALGTSMPKLIVGVIAGMSGQSDLVLGNIVGGNIANVLLVLGIGAVIAPVGFPSKDSRLELYSFVLSSVLLLALAWDGTLSRIDGALLFAFGAAFIAAIIHLNRDKERVLEKVEEALAVRHRRERLRNLLAIGGGVAMLFAGAVLMVDNASTIARMFGVSELLIGLTLVGVGTSLPEVVTTAVSSARRTHALTLGNLIGSNILNILTMLGLTLMIAPARVAPSLLRFDLPVLVLVSIGVTLLIRGGRKLSRVAGVSLIVVYGAYMVTALVMHGGPR